MTGTSQLPLELPHLDSLRRQDFFVSDSNRLAAGIVDLWPEWPEFAQLIIGPPAHRRGRRHRRYPGDGRENRRRRRHGGGAEDRLRRDAGRALRFAAGGAALELAGE